MSNQFLQNILDKLSKAAIPIGVGFSVLSASMYNGNQFDIENDFRIVEGGQRAIIFDRVRGVLPEAVGEGTHFLIPWLQKIYIMDVRTRARSIPTNTGTKDMQNVSLVLRVLHKPLVEQLPELYSKFGLDYEERILPSIGNEVLKAVVAQFDCGELITQRELVSQRIREDLVKRAKDFNILLEDVSITHLTFGKEFTTAVESKQVAQQEAERAKFIVEKAEQEKLASIIRAEGEAQAANLISRAVEKYGEGLIELRSIEAAREIASTLAQAKNVSYLPGSNNGQQLLLNVSN